MARTTRRSPSNQKEEEEEEEKEDILLNLMAKLANGDSHWYIINGDTSSNLSMCRQLGFFSRMNVYSCLVMKGLAHYKFSKKTRRMEIDVLGCNWPAYLVSKKYGLSTQNAEHSVFRFDMENLLVEKRQRDDARVNFHIIRLGRTDSGTYCKKSATKQTRRLRN